LYDDGVLEDGTIGVGIALMMMLLLMLVGLREKTPRYKIRWTVVL
jgi:hypothetical protein